MPRYPIVPPDTTLARSIDKADHLTHRLMRGTKRLHLSPIRRRRLNALLGTDRHVSHLTLADVDARKASSQIFFAVVEEQVGALIPAGAPTCHLTLVDDIGLTTDRDPIIRLTAFRRKVDKAIRSLGLSGVAVMEIQPLTNYPAKGEGRTLMLNTHVLGWGPVSRRKFRAALKKLNASRSWSNAFAAKPIKSRRLKHGVDDALKIICYQTKVPYGAKYRVPCPGRPGRYRFKPTLTGFTDTLALRLMEGLSQISIYDSVFCIGDAKHIRKVWKTRLMEWQRLRSEVGRGPIADFDVPKLWRRIRKTNGSEHYQPFKIV